VAKVAEVIGVIGKDLAHALRLQQHELNRKFQLAKQFDRSLEDAAFSAFIRNTLDPIATAVASRHPDRLLEVIDLLYDMALPLVARGWLGGVSRIPALEAGWRTLLVGLAPWLGVAPKKVAGSMLNALHQLSELGGEAPNLWIEDLVRLSSQFTQLDEIFATGRVLAWRHGLAATRTAAIDAALSLQAPIVQNALRLPQPLSAENWLRMKAESQTMPMDCLSSRVDAPTWMRWVGGYSGLGGDFRRLPRVAADETGTYVTDGHKVWALVADGYGAQLISVHNINPWSDDAQPTAHVTPDGLITVNRRQTHFASFPAPRQGAWHNGLLAVTSHVTHRVGLIRWDAA
jgi:hypothetical protein